MLEGAWRELWRVLTFIVPSVVHVSRIERVQIQEHPLCLLHWSDASRRLGSQGSLAHQLTLSP